jgi:hypothetical protein
MTKNPNFLRRLLAKRKGQLMLLTVLMIGGTMLAATTITGLILTYQIRQSTDFADSAKAIFAADTGIEWGLYELYNASSSRPEPTLSNGAVFSFGCFDGYNNPVQCGAPSAEIMKSIGSAGNVQRAFSQSF